MPTRSGGVAFAVVPACVHVDLACEPPQPARGGPADARRQLAPLVVRGHDDEPPLLLPLVDEVVDAVTRPARPVLGPKVVENDDVVAARVGRGLPVPVALPQGVQPAGDVEEECGLALLAPDDLSQDGHGEVRLAGAGVPAQEKALAQVGAGPELLGPLPAD